MKGFFVTGTDTGVGKTYVTAALTKLLRSRGQKVFAFKPVETGCELKDGRLVGADQELISEAAENWQTGPLRGLYQFRSPVAPHVAAAAESTVIDIDLVVRTVAEGARQADVAVVEGAGGWRVPLTESVDMAGLARTLGLPVIVVARATLGTINHTLLTVEAVGRDLCSVAAVVLSLRPDESAEFARSNAGEISRRWTGQVLILGSDSESLAMLVDPE
jgi:dethiobiotin synthetase